jgi:glycosyltransferase 2 family protein
MPRQQSKTPRAPPGATEVRLKRPTLKTALKALVVVAIAVFLGLALRREAVKLREVEFAFHVLPFLASTVLVLAQFFQQSTCWWIILRGVAGPVPHAEAQATWYASQVSKYVPGRVMLPLMRYTLLRRRGVALGRTMVSIYLELALMTGAAILLALLSSIGFPLAVWDMLAAHIHWFGDGASLRWTVLALVPLTLVGIHPRLLQWVVNLGLRLVKKDPVTFTITYPRMLALGAAYVVGWALYGASAWLLMVSLGIDDPALAYKIVAAFVVAWVIGFLSFITPGGIGIREGVLAALLTLWGVPLPIAGVAAVLGRLQWTGNEFIGALATVRYRPRPPEEN